MDKCHSKHEIRSLYTNTVKRVSYCLSLCWCTKKEHHCVGVPRTNVMLASACYSVASSPGSPVNVEKLGIGPGNKATIAQCMLELLADSRCCFVEALA